MNDLIGDAIQNLDLVLFSVVAVVVLISAFMMLEAKNLTHAIIYLALTFAGIAVIYILLSAEFIAMIQMTVYTGGVIVLFLFALMLTRSQEFNLKGDLNRNMNALLGFLLITVFVLIIMPISDLWVSGVNPFDIVYSSAANGFPNGIAWVGFSLFNYYQIGFIVLGLIVVAALIGTIYIVKNEPGEDIRVVSPASLKEEQK